MIVVFGSMNIDLIMPVSHFPTPGETVLCTSDYLSHAGGKGANQAVAASRAGGKVALVGKVGDDSFGRRCINNLKGHSIWTSGIGISEHPTGCATIAVDGHGSNMVMVAPGANADVTADQAPDEILGKRHIVLTQLEVPAEEASTLLARARAQGGTTIFNAAPARAMPPDILKSVDYLIVNEIEAQQLARNFGLDGSDAKKLALELSRRGPLCCIITLEAKGCIAARDGKVYSQPALKVDVIDTTGAGDAFCGIFAAGLQKGMPWLEAMHRAGAGASLSCLGLGAQTGMPYAEDIDAAVAQMPGPQEIPAQ